MQLYHLAYISRSLLEGTNQVIEWELESILDAALRNNPGMGLTGALLYSGGYFCQVLEGPEDSVRQLFSKICLDERHHEVNTLFFEQVPERQFGMWAMAFAGIEAQQRFKVVGVKKDKDAIAAKQLGKDMVDSLLKMVAQQERAAPPRGPVSRKLPPM